MIQQFRKPLNDRQPEPKPLSLQETLISWAERLGNSKAAALLKKMLDEEYAADKALSKTTKDRLNADAAA